MTRRGRAKRRKPAAEAYHDRVAGRYDHIYRGAYWKVVEELSWEGIKPHIPNDLAVEICDLGCGTGLYGLKLLKSGYRVTFCDLAAGMLERARKKAAELPGGASSRARFVRTDIADLHGLEAARFGLAIAQGDPISHAGRRAPEALRACARALRPGGILVASVDNALAGLEHYLQKRDIDGLESFVATGLTEWLARADAERFAVRMFTPRELRRLLERSGFEVLDLFGKPVLGLRGREALLADADARRRVLALERKLCREEAMLGRAAHLQVAARKKG